MGNTNNKKRAQNIKQLFAHFCAYKTKYKMKNEKVFVEWREC